MLSAGDVQGCLRKLESLLRSIKYPGNVNYDGLSKGDPSACLPILSYALTSFSAPFTEQLMAAGHELTGKTDLRFTDALYKVLRDVLHYKPVLTKQQFLQWGFSHRKISVLCDIISMVMHKHTQLKKPRVRFPASQKYNRGEAHPMLTDADSVPNRPLVVNHMELPPGTFPTSSHHVEEFCSRSPAHLEVSVEEEEGHTDNSRHSLEVEERLSALEGQLESLLSRLDRVRVLERRLGELERARHTDKNTGPVITIPRESWENVMSRLLLLETKLELRNPQLTSQPPCESASPCCASSVLDSPKEDLKDRLQRITDMMKSTSSLLKNPESSPCK